MRGRRAGSVVGGVPSPVPALAALALLLAGAPTTGAQTLDISGYALGLGATYDGSALGPGGTTLVARVRGMSVATLGSLSLDVAYEHLLTRMPKGGTLSLTPGGADVRTGDWLGADWEIRSTERGTWRHRLDRTSVSLELGRTSVTVGRQAISWATTLFLTPADPFAPFDPSDPFREYRAGVDAIRVRVSPGPFTELELVARATDTPEGARYTTLARAQTSVHAWAVGGWGGVLHGEAAGAVFATGSVGSTAVRGEASLRRAPDGTLAGRGAVGLDWGVLAAGRDLFLVAEVQRDGFGATDTSRLLAVAASEPFLRGEMQTLGAWSAAVRASYQVHPLVALDLMLLGSLPGESAMMAPGVSWSASEAASLRLGMYVGIGPSGLDPAKGLASEFGPVPLFGYAALSWFF